MHQLIAKSRARDVEDLLLLADLARMPTFVNFDLPAQVNAGDVPALCMTVMRGVASGKISLEELERLMQVPVLQARLFGTRGKIPRRVVIHSSG